jgi:hypothetical protein
VRRSLLLLVVVTLVGVACDPEPTETAPTGPPPPPPSIDPLVPFSPAPTPFEEVTSGFLGDTLTLPGTGDTTIHVDLVNTALPYDPRPDGTRPFSVFLTVTNAGDDAWTGVPGQGARVTDAAGGYNEAEADPSPADLHPRPQRLGVSNGNLMQQITLEPGESVEGVVVFLTAGGNRPVTVSVSFDGGATQGTWQTSMGPS